MRKKTSIDKKVADKKMIGDLSLHFEGYGFVNSSTPGVPDVFIPARCIGDALHGDTVEVSVKTGLKGLSEGVICNIIQRNLKQLVGRLEQQGQFWTVVSEDPRVRQRMRIPKLPKDFRFGDYVVARITQYPLGQKPMVGEIVEKLPTRGTLMAEIEYVIAKHQWPKKFPKEVEQEAININKKGIDVQSSMPAPRRLGSDERKDLRDLQFVTIDGETAKDFDDAVYAERLAGGNIRLLVAIADVSHYVTPNSPLDREALARSTSVYFPGRVLPMLPEALSNDLCSLKPNEDRLALVAEMEIDPAGESVGEKFYTAIFQSQARLTYTIVRRLVVDKEEALRQEMQVILPMVETLSEVAGNLKKMRTNRGTIDFDLPEPEIILDMTGGIEHIEKSQRNWSHQIIEELMIAANEAVARFLTRKKVGCVYRTHDGPNAEKIRNFYKMVQVLGFNGRFQFPVNSNTLMKVVNHFRGHAEMRLVNSVLLRSMAQAVYSANNIGHFGLASLCYCHFTSPIRRYPDLIVHRLFKQALGMAEQKKMPEFALQQMAEHCSKQERKAMEAEREMLALHKTLFMQDKVGNEYDGIISHVTKFGFFVELLDYFVEGLVPLQSLSGDVYVYDEEHFCLKGRKNKKTHKIGNKVRIVVEEVKVPDRKVFFNLLEV
ncbi:MAG: ribonuclease R [Deltaproteobacteria bacterium]|nr:ribonuclease R [Deltaproteobacteria bacterium]